MSLRSEIENLEEENYEYKSLMIDILDRLMKDYMYYSIREDVINYILRKYNTQLSKSIQKKQLDLDGIQHDINVYSDQLNFLKDQVIRLRLEKENLEDDTSKD